MTKNSELYSETWDLIYQTSSVTGVVYDILQQVNIADNELREKIDRCTALLSMLPEKFKRLELISDERTLIENKEFASLK